MIDISGRIPSVGGINREGRVQDKDVGSFPMTCHKAALKLWSLQRQTIDRTYSLDLSVDSYISSPTYSKRGVV